MPEESTDILDPYAGFMSITAPSLEAMARLGMRPIAGADDGDGGDAAGDAGDGGDGDAGAAEEGQGGDSALEGGTTEKPPEKPDVSQSVERLNQRLDEFMESQKPDAVEEWMEDLDGGDEYEYVDEGGEPPPDPYAEYEDPQAAEAMRALDERIDERAREMLQPHLQQQAEEKRLQQTQALEQKYPDLQKEENAVPLLQAAERLADGLGEPGLAYEAEFLETVYLRMRAEEAAADESDSGSNDETPVEGGGGPAPATAQKDHAQGIVDAGKAKSIFG